MKTRAHKEAEHILGREVEQVLMQHQVDKECADCKKPARYLIVEKEESSEDEYPRNIMRAWYHCGVCEVG